MQTADRWLDLHRRALVLPAQTAVVILSWHVIPGLAPVLIEDLAGSDLRSRTTYGGAGQRARGSVIA